MKRLILVFVILIAGGININMRPADDPFKIKVVVIDAGHGGHDSGALGKKAKEKDIALAIALKVGKYIENNCKDVKVIYTRNTDVFVELYRRAEIANQANADLFISIHCNAIDNPKPHGTETWVMGLHKSKANLDVAKKENSAILLESNSAESYGNFDPNSPESYIIFSLYQSKFREQSIDFASKVENEFENRVGRFNRGVKEAGFLVLWKTTMPSILIETGFVSNPDEEKFLMSEQGQDYLSSAIYRAFKQYKKEMEVGTETTSTTEKQNEKPVKDNGSVVESDIDTTANSSETTKATPNEIIFGVQFTTSTDKKPASAQSFLGLEDVWSYYHSGRYKYVSGRYSNIDDAISQLKIVRSKGFTDAFVVAFEGDKRISPTEATKLLEKKNNKN